jgi:hypothetical protein
VARVTDIADGKKQVIWTAGKAVLSRRGKGDRGVPWSGRMPAGLRGKFHCHTTSRFAVEWVSASSRGSLSEAAVSFKSYFCAPRAGEEAGRAIPQVGHIFKFLFSTHAFNVSGAT